jgi:UDP-glucose 4-epimerase
VCALTVPLTGHQRVNLGRGEETSILQLHALLCAAVGRQQTPTFGPARTGDVFRSYTATEQAQRLLGFTAQHTVAQGLEELVRWYRATTG